MHPQFVAPRQSQPHPQFLATKHPQPQRLLQVVRLRAAAFPQYPLIHNERFHSPRYNYRVSPPQHARFYSDSIRPRVRLPCRAMFNGHEQKLLHDQWLSSTGQLDPHEMLKTGETEMGFINSVQESTNESTKVSDNGQMYDRRPQRGTQDNINTREKDQSAKTESGLKFNLETSKPFVGIQRSFQTAYEQELNRGITDDGRNLKLTENQGMSQAFPIGSRLVQSGESTDEGSSLTSDWNGEYAGMPKAIPIVNRNGRKEEERNQSALNRITEIQCTHAENVLQSTNKSKQVDIQNVLEENHLSEEQTIKIMDICSLQDTETNFGLGFWSADQTTEQNEQNSLKLKNNCNNYNTNECSNKTPPNQVKNSFLHETLVETEEHITVQEQNEVQARESILNIPQPVIAGMNSLTENLSQKPTTLKTKTSATGLSKKTKQPTPISEEKASASIKPTWKKRAGVKCKLDESQGKRNKICHDKSSISQPNNQTAAAGLNADTSLTRNVSLTQQNKSTNETNESPRIINIGLGSSVTITTVTKPSPNRVGQRGTASHQSMAESQQTEERPIISTKLPAPFVCKRHCQKTFLYEETFTEHEHRCKEPSRQCNLCSARFPTQPELAHHRQYYHRVETGLELAIPVVDLKETGVVERLTSCGIRSFIPVPQLSVDDKGRFGIPIVMADESGHYGNGTNGLGLNCVFSLGPLQHIIDGRLST